MNRTALLTNQSALLVALVISLGIATLCATWKVLDDTPPPVLPAPVAKRAELLQLDRTASSVREPVAVSLQDVSPNLKWAVLAAEDHRFYQHHGIDPVAMMRALLTGARSGHMVEGASTITQQLAKNSFLKWEDRSARRKLKAWMLAWQLEQRYTKDRILETYLNQIYLGRGAYGIECAAQRYFGVHAHELSLSQASFLAAIIRAPSELGAPGHEQQAIRRQHQILANMVRYGYITEKQRILAANDRVQSVHQLSLSAR